MEMQPPRHLWIGALHLRTHIENLRRIGLPGSVGKRYLMHADGEIGFDDFFHVAIGISLSHGEPKAIEIEPDIAMSAAFAASTQAAKPATVSAACG